MVRTHTDENGIVIAGDDAELIDDGDDRVDPDDDGVEILTDGGRPPRSSFDHAPDVGAGDVDKCFECGRYAPHAFDHAPDCSRFEPIEADPDVGDSSDNVTPSARNNPRMVRPTSDGGDTRFDKPPQSPERIASQIVKAQVGTRVSVYCSTDGTLSIFEGVVTSSGYKPDPEDEFGGTHVVAIDVAGDRVAVHFDRHTDADGELNVPDPVLFDPCDGARLPVTRFEPIDD